MLFDSSSDVSLAEKLPTPVKGNPSSAGYLGPKRLPISGVGGIVHENNGRRTSLPYVRQGGRGLKARVFSFLRLGLGSDVYIENALCDVDVCLYDYLKRVFDIVGAMLAIVLSLPLMAVAVAAVKLNSRGPVIFRQKRLTRGGRVFTMFKLRTMYTDAENRSGAVWAEADDPRVTKVGRFLRRTRIDELPQLWNVLIGDMSLIGPRPERPELARELAREVDGFHRRLQVRAGITGLAQISSGYASCVRSSRNKLRLDLVYIRNRCIMLDMSILIRTVSVIFTGHGSR